MDILYQNFLIILVIKKNKYSKLVENYLFQSVWKFDFIFKTKENTLINLIDYNFIFYTLEIEKVKTIIITNSLEFSSTSNKLLEQELLNNK